MCYIQLMNKKDFYDLIRYVPKAELHIHQEAAVSRETVKKLYKKSQGKDITEGELNDIFTYDDLPSFLASFMKIQSFYKSEEDFACIIEDIRSYLKDNNIVYCETFVAPTSNLRNGFDFAKMLEILDKGYDLIKKEDHRTVRIIVDVSRSFGAENAMHNLELVLGAKDPHIIGIGLGGDEAKGPAKDYAQVFKRAHEEGLHTVLHAGETVDSWSVDDAVEKCFAERIGHGITVCQDDALAQKLIERKIPIEICMTSNTFTKNYVKDIKDHPVRAFYENGVPITINTDDPTFFRCSLLDEYWKLYDSLGFSLDEILDIIKKGFRAAFISDSMKKKYITRVNKAWKEWFDAHPNAK